MERVKITQARPDARVLARAVAVLRDGGLVAYPTETFYGLGADPGSDVALDALYRAKGRPTRMAIPLIAGSVEQLTEAAGALSPLGQRLAERFWPGPLTLVIPAWNGLSSGVHGGRGTVAVRVPGALLARSLCDAFGRPITSTSANPSGQPPAEDGDAVESRLSTSLSILLDGGPAPGGLPSTIVDVIGNQPRLIRRGAIAWEQVLECVEH